MKTNTLQQQNQSTINEETTNINPLLERKNTILRTKTTIQR